MATIIGMECRLSNEYGLVYGLSLLFPGVHITLMDTSTWPTLEQLESGQEFTSELESHSITICEKRMNIIIDADESITSVVVYLTGSNMEYMRELSKFGEYVNGNREAYIYTGDLNITTIFHMNE